MSYFCIDISKVWKELFICLSITLTVTAHRTMLIGYVPWCHVVDLRRVYQTPFAAEAVVSRFFNTGNVSVHVWNATSRRHYYTMLQETQLDTPQATGRLEVVRLREKLFIAEGSMLGVSAGERDTMECEFDEDGMVFVSDLCLHSGHDNASEDGVWPPQTRRFLNLMLPYTLPVYPCTDHDCRESINELLNNEDELIRLHMSRWELLDLLDTRTTTLTTTQLDNETRNVNDSVTGDGGWTHNDVNTRMLGDATMNPVISNQSTVQMTSNDSLLLPPSWLSNNDSFAEQSLPEEMVNASDTNLGKTSTDAAVNETYYNGTTTGPAVTEERTTCTNASRQAENDTSTESLPRKGDKNIFPWPAWLFDNGSISDHSILEQLIKKHKDDMVRPSDEDGGPVSAEHAEDESHGRYHTVVGLVIWNVVVTMLLFTMIVALFLVCTNNRRSRFRFADSYTVNAYDDDPVRSKA